MDYLRYWPWICLDSLRKNYDTSTDSNLASPEHKSIALNVCTVFSDSPYGSRTHTHTHMITGSRSVLVTTCIANCLGNKNDPLYWSNIDILTKAMASLCYAKPNMTVTPRWRGWEMKWFSVLKCCLESFSGTKKSHPSPSIKNCDSNSSQVEFKQHFGSDSDSKFVSMQLGLNRSLSSCVVIGCWMKWLGDYVKWKKIGKFTVKALFPHSMEGRWRTRSRTAAGPTDYRIGDNCFAKLLGAISWIEIYPWDET